MWPLPCALCRPRPIWAQARRGYPRKEPALCGYEVAAEQKARSTYERLINLADDPDIIEPLKFLRQREVIHFQRFGEAVRLAKEKMDQKNIYFVNPVMDR